MNEHTPATASPATRRARIVELIAHEGEQRVELLAEQFEVSGMTIRRDLQELADTGRVARTHGGAAVAPRASFEFRFLERTELQRAEKEAIASLAASLIQPGASVILDSGTTTLQIARQLRAKRDITVIITSLPIASELFGVEGVTTLLLGGELRKNSPDLFGALADQTLDTLRADWAFIGADAIDAEGNLYNASADIGRLLARMARCATQAYAVADHTKIGRKQLMRFGQAPKWRGLITDAGLTRRTQRSLEKAGVNVLVARRHSAADLS